MNLSLADYLIENPILSPLRLVAWEWIGKVLARKHLMIVPADTLPQRAGTYELIRQAREETSLVQLDSEAFLLCAQARRSAKIPGEMAELGVYRGGSARLICAVKGERPLHLFDTFEGLPEATEHDPKFRGGGFQGSLEEVQKLLQPFPAVHYHKGFFPQSAEALGDLRFSFVHLDVDLYQSTVSGLEWFYPRLHSGGILISHDYPVAEGVRKAFDEFFADKPESLIELSGNQVAFVKL